MGVCVGMLRARISSAWTRLKCWVRGHLQRLIIEEMAQAVGRKDDEAVAGWGLIYFWVWVLTD